MPDQTPSLDDFRRAYEADDNEWWLLGCGHHMNLFDEALDRIDEARDWAAWFAAERDQLRADHAEEMAAVKGWQTPYRDRIDQLELVCSETRLQLEAANTRIHEWRVHFAEIVDALGLPEDTQFDCLPVEAREARARITELEAALEAKRTQHAETLGMLEGAYEVIERDRVALEAAQGNSAPHVIANATELDTLPVGAVILAGTDNSKVFEKAERLDHPFTRDGARSVWWEIGFTRETTTFEIELPATVLFVPGVVGTETGTRPATAPQSDPAGYVVVTRNPEGGVHRSATVWDSLEQANTAEGIASGYADGTGCTAVVYELREVRGA